MAQGIRHIKNPQQMISMAYAVKDDVVINNVTVVILPVENAIEIRCEWIVNVF